MKVQVTSETLKGFYGENEAQALYQALKAKNGFLDFARQFVYNEDAKVARNALWVLTKANDKELSALQPFRNELIDLAMTTKHSAVRRLSLNIVERLKMDKDDLQTEFLDFCLEHMLDVEELPGVQAICMKLAYRMCMFYPELMEELKRTLQAMAIEYYKPAVKCTRNRILNGRLKWNAIR